jgi:putative transcriptional regulator
MTITHHVDDASLMSFAAGTLPEALGAVVATHLTMCARCRDELVAMERVGAVMMSVLPAAPLTKSAPRTLARPVTIGADEGDHVLAAIERSGDIPAPLSKFVGSDLSSIQWKRLGLGVWHLPLPLSAGAKGDLRLIKVGPGQAMPEHGHGGSELSLILAGSYTDKIGRFGVGDVADLDDEVEHKPMADLTTGCVCLIASEEKAKFKGLFARLVQPFVGM